MISKFLYIFTIISVVNSSVHAVTFEDIGGGEGEVSEKNNRYSVFSADRGGDDDLELPEDEDTDGEIADLSKRAFDLWNFHNGGDLKKGEKESLLNLSQDKNTDDEGSPAEGVNSSFQNKMMSGVSNFLRDAAFGVALTRLMVMSIEGGVHLYSKGMIDERLLSYCLAHTLKFFYRAWVEPKASLGNYFSRVVALTAVDIIREQVAIQSADWAYNQVLESNPFNPDKFEYAVMERAIIEERPYFKNVVESSAVPLFYTVVGVAFNYAGSVLHYCYGGFCGKKTKAKKSLLLEETEN